MCQFGTPIINVCAGEKCVSLEHLLSMSVLVRNVLNCCAGEQHGFRKAENIQDALDGEFYFFGKVLGFTPADNIKKVQNSQALFVFHIFKLKKKILASCCHER